MIADIVKGFLTSKTTMKRWWICKIIACMLMVIMGIIFILPGVDAVVGMNRFAALSVCLLSYAVNYCLNRLK